jgi:hypothetical protein
MEVFTTGLSAFVATCCFATLYNRSLWMASRKEVCNTFSMASISRSLRDFFVREEAPVDWLWEMGCFGLHSYFALVFALHCSLLGCVMLLRSNVFSAASLITVGGMLSTIPFVCSRLPFQPQKASTSEAVVATLYTIIFCFGSWVFVNLPDAVMRQRSMGMGLIFGRTAALMIGFRMVPTMIIFCIIGLNDVATTWYVTYKFQDSTEILFRLPAVILFLSLLYLVACVHQQCRWRMLHDTQALLTAEKTAMESLLAMVCDSIFWLSTEGNHVSKSCVQFDAIMGQEMCGVDLSEMIDNAECSDFLKDGNARESSPVALFPTLVISATRTVRAELFIVDRRRSVNRPDKNTSDAMGFLVGLRLCDAFSIEPPASTASGVTLSGAPRGPIEVLDDDLNGSVELDGLATCMAGNAPGMAAGRVVFEDDCSDSTIPLGEKMQVLTGGAGDRVQVPVSFEADGNAPGMAAGRAAFEDDCSDCTIPLEEKMQLLTGAAAERIQVSFETDGNALEMAAGHAVFENSRDRSRLSGIAGKMHELPICLAPSATTDSRSVSSQSSRPRSILRRHPKPSGKVDQDLHDGPIHSSAFSVSGTYLTECSLSLLEDLISSWNFHVSGCCAWHASLKHLMGMINQMKDFRCCHDEWRPDVVWQCRKCTALSVSGAPEDACWLCYEPNSSSDDGNVGSTLQQQQKHA